jgi:UDP-GlcNAc:undecaprenyl-phosphate GlcNAc-1-phosphate transferase
VALAFPLLVLAIPILDTSFVVLKRLKYRRPITQADTSHLHHRFMSLGFTQRRAVLTMYVWCGTLAAAALATRFIPPRPHGRWQAEATIEAGLIGLTALVTSIYVVYLLEIVKVANPRIRRRERDAEKRRSA